jgi:hypothetical protein
MSWQPTGYVGDARAWRDLSRKKVVSLEDLLVRLRSKCKALSTSTFESNSVPGLDEQSQRRESWPTRKELIAGRFSRLSMTASPFAAPKPRCRDDTMLKLGKQGKCAKQPHLCYILPRGLEQEV